MRLFMINQLVSWLRLLLVGLFFSLLLYCPSIQAQGDNDFDGENDIEQDEPPRIIDQPGCWSDMATADVDGDGYVRNNEYLFFIQEYGKRICYFTDSLTLQQAAAYNYLACICRSVEGADENCCLGANAGLPTSGALDDDRTAAERGYLTTVCRVTDATLEHLCTPAPKLIGEPPGFFTIPGDAFLNSDDGRPAWWVYALAILAILLLLLLLCCCCCRRRQDQVDDEVVVTKVTDIEAPADREVRIPGEEVIEEVNQVVTEIHDEEIEEPPPPEPEPQIQEIVEEEELDDEVQEEEEVVEEVTETEIVEEELLEDEEGRRKRGGGNKDGDDEDEQKRTRGAGLLPPPEKEEPERVNLKPIPRKEEEEKDEWDQPGRDISFEKETDEYSAGQVDHYEPDGGVNIPQRPQREPVGPPNVNWQREEKEDPDEVDNRKHRVQAGLGQGEVWDQLDDDDGNNSAGPNLNTTAMDWVVQSMLDGLRTTDEQGELDDESTNVDSKASSQDNKQQQQK